MALLHLSRPACELCMQGDWKEAERTITEEIAHSSNPGCHSLASRALVRARLQDWNGAYHDAQQVSFLRISHSLVFTCVHPKSLKVQLSVIGYIAKAMARVGQGESQAGIRAFDLTFMRCNLAEIPFLFLIRVRVPCARYLVPTNPKVYLVHYPV